jgi:hypothetical protein
MSRLTFFTAESPDAYVFDKLVTEMIDDMVIPRWRRCEAYRNADYTGDAV